MATSQTITDGVESKVKVTSRLEIFDFMFLVGGIGFALVTKGLVHESLAVPYVLFCFLCACFMTARSSFNKRRRNFESLYFLIIKEVGVYHPIVAGGKDEKE